MEKNIASRRVTLAVLVSGFAVLSERAATCFRTV